MGFGPLRVINEDVVEGGKRLKDAPAPRHGDHLLCARRGARAPRLDGHGVGHPTWRAAALSAGTGVTHSSSTHRPRTPRISCRSGSSPPSAARRRVTSSRAFPAAERALGALVGARGARRRRGRVDGRPRRSPLRHAPRGRGSSRLPLRGGPDGWLTRSRAARCALQARPCGWATASPSPTRQR